MIYPPRIKIKMTPGPTNELSIGGVDTVVREYIRVLGDSVEWVNDVKPNVEIVHAGMKPFDSKKGNNIAMLHGLYWTGGNTVHDSFHDYYNAAIVDNIRHARVVTAPSDWVAQTIRREARIEPIIIPHGVNTDLWRPSDKNEGFVFWAKNRIVDVCTPEMLYDLAPLMPDTQFICTLGLPNRVAPPNLTVIGRVLSQAEMMDYVSRCGIFISTTQETFGIAALEAMAMGKPVLTGSAGNVPDLIKRNVAGYTAEQTLPADFKKGAEWILNNYSTLSQNAVTIAKRYTWEKAAELFMEAVAEASRTRSRHVSIVIPAHNKQATVRRAIDSAIAQRCEGADIDIVVVDDSSTDDTYKEIVSAAFADDLPDHVHIYAHTVSYGNVAHTRNYGAWAADQNTEYYVFLDADDWLDPQFLSATIPSIEQDNSTHIAYTKITAHRNNEHHVSVWPPNEPDFYRQMNGQNQIPTCCLIRGESFRSSGGYRARYAPMGAGSEDANLWLTMGSHGKWAVNASDKGFFHYTMGGGGTSQRGYKEVPWAANYPFTSGKLIPFMSVQDVSNMSHPVRPYDCPLVSIIIPVGPGHELSVVNALDSLEWQTISNWEGIVVWNSDIEPDPWIVAGYPHLRWIYLDRSNVSAARNAGVEASRAPIIAFLDADDYLLPEFLEQTLPHAMNGNIAYTDYVGRYLSEERPDTGRERLLDWDPITKVAKFKGIMLDYDKNKAVAQPQRDPPYVWCATNMVMPKKFHRQIGGFKEELLSWEDWDYQIRLAKSGYNFTRIPNALFVYDFDSGKRRRVGLKDFETEGLFDKVGRLQ